MHKMGPNSMKREFRRQKLLEHLISVRLTSYKRIRDLFDVTDKTIRDDLAYVLLQFHMELMWYLRL